MNKIKTTSKMREMLPRETYCPLNVIDEAGFAKRKRTWREGELTKVIL
jgi:hypothetical protein